MRGFVFAGYRGGFSGLVLVFGGGFLDEASRERIGTFILGGLFKSVFFWLGQQAGAANEHIELTILLVVLLALGREEGTTGIHAGSSTDAHWRPS